MNRRIWMLAVVAVLALTGCVGRKYERIAVTTEYEPPKAQTEQLQEEQSQEEQSQEEQSQKGQSQDEDGLRDGIAEAEIVIGPEGGSSDAELVIEPETGTGEGQSDDAGQDITLLFAGDVLLSEHVLQAYDRAGGIHGVLDEGYLQAIRAADFFMVNQEFPFSSRGTQAPDKQFTFRLAPERAAIFEQIGIDGVTLANNHALDFGQDALLDSCDVLDSAGILHTGAGKNLEEAKKPVIAEIGKKRIAVIGATRVIPVADWAAGTNHAGMLATYDPSVLLGEIAKLKKENDYVIVFVHWGIEREETPQEYQRKLGQQYIDAGADLVIGAHPHVLQGIEYYQGKPIVYSLGNFIFGSSIPRTTLLEVTAGAGEQERLDLRLLPGTSGAGYTHMLEDGKKRQEFFRYMEEISFGVTFLEDGEVVWKQE